MKIYKGLELQLVVEDMNAIIYSTDLTEDKNNYDHLLTSRGARFLDDSNVCIMTDDKQSFLLAVIDDNMIEVEMWAGMNNKIGFKAMFQYISTLKSLFDNNREIIIRANFRTTTSLPIMQKLIDRYGMEVEYIDNEENGFRNMSIIYNPTR